MNAVRKSWFVAWVLLALLGTGACAAAPPAYREAEHAHGRLQKSSGVWVLALSGTAMQRGQATGALVGEQIRWLLPRYLKQAVGRQEIPASLAPRIEAMSAKVPEKHLAQLKALAKAARVSPLALMAANLSTELQSIQACSCIATGLDRSPDSKVRLARNLDWPAGDLLMGLALVIIESGPELGHAFVSFSWPGLVGAVTGMNDAGLCVADLMAYPEPPVAARSGVPVLFAVRSMLEQAEDVQQASAWLKAAERSIPQNYAMADPKQALTIETGPTRFRPRPNQSGLAAITNFWNEDTANSRHKRYRALFAQVGEKKPDVPILKQALTEVALGKLNVQALIMEPAQRIVHLSIGRPPAANGPWVRLDLSAWLANP